MSLKKQAKSGIKWSFIQQISVQAINFVVQVMLARLLMPEVFGLIAMIIVFISIGQTLMDGGMTSSIIRTKNPNQIDYSTVFITNLSMSCVLYTLTYIAAPLIAEFYGQDVLINIIRLFAISFIIDALVAVHIAKLTKEMKFKLQMQLQIPSAVIAGLVGITMAYNGFGVWSLVWLNLIRSSLFAIQVWLLNEWRPSLMFNKDRFKYHFNFGYKLTIANLLNTIFNDSYRIIIGKFYSPLQVGLYNNAETMRLFPVDQITAVLGKVTYPLFANIKEDTELKKAYRITLRIVLFIVVPIMFYLILIADEGFELVFGKQWLPAVPYFQILAFASMVKPISAYNLSILKVKGKSDLLLKLEVFKKILGVIAILIGLSFDIIGLLISYTIWFYIVTIIDMHYSGKLIEYSVKEQVVDSVSILFFGAIVFIFLLFVKSRFVFEYDLVTILFYMFSFFGLYMTLLFVFDKKLITTLKVLGIFHKQKY